MNILILQASPRAKGNTVWMAEKYKNIAFVAILFFGACLFSACSKGDDEKGNGRNTITIWIVAPKSFAQVGLAS